MKRVLKFVRQNPWRILCLLFAIFALQQCFLAWRNHFDIRRLVEHDMHSVVFLEEGEGSYPRYKVVLNKKDWQLFFQEDAASERLVHTGNYLLSFRRVRLRGAVFVLMPYRLQSGKLVVLGDRGYLLYPKGSPPLRGSEQTNS
jgi:hypothetical protein